jgi:hypothetical protein
MKSIFYDFESSPDALRFEFDSVSPQKQIRKVVEYTVLSQNQNIYNLGFGDKKEDGNIDDLVVSNNRDMELVLATVIQTIFKFFDTRPDKTLIFLGSTESRTRLYQMVIVKHIEDAEKFFYLRGIRGGEIQDFIKGLNYDAFLINLRKT